MMLVGILLLFFVTLVEGTVLFSCSFRRDLCGMSNQEGVKALWKRQHLRLGGRNGYAMSVTGNEARDHFARITTPHVDSRGATRGCLSFLYFVDGLSPASLACIKQGYVTSYLFATARKTQDHWATAKVDFEFLGDGAMFYFEADTRVQEFGNSIVAFTDVRITNRPCNSDTRLTKLQSHKNTLLITIAEFPDNSQLMDTPSYQT